MTITENAGIQCPLPRDACGKVLPSEGARNHPFVMVMFGGAGDLARKKLLPTLFRPFRDNLLPDSFAVAGFGRTPLSTEQYRDMVSQSVARYCEHPAPPGQIAQFARRFHYLSGVFEDDSKYRELAAFLEEQAPLFPDGGFNLLFYLAVPPESVPVIIDKLHQSGLAGGRFPARIILEKPFGTDQSSANRLNRQVLKAFPEDRVFRIDHYLGKETVQNLMFFRFGNSIFEPLWNRNYVDHVQITVAETVGIENRGNFYEQAGIARDIIQNHMLQLLAHTAMEPPAGFDADLIRDEKIKIYSSFRKMDPEHLEKCMIQGQYGPGSVQGEPVAGYRQEARVHPESRVPTYMAGKFYIDNWRWAGVPFYVRSGKRLAKRITEIYVEFKQPPLKLMGRACQETPNALALQIQPEESITLLLNAKGPGVQNLPHPVRMEFNYAQSFDTAAYPPYARLLIDCLRGDLTLFARQDGIEAMWGVVDPVIQFWESHPAADFPNYEAGSWGPDKACTMMTGDGRQWRTW